MEKYTFTFIDVDSNTKYVLKHGCKGWGEFGVSYGREERISNVVKSYTDNWGFIKEDGDWLVNRLFTYGPNRRIKLVVEKCVDYLAGTYRKEYVGYVDLTQLEIGMGEVTVPVNSGGFFKALENKWGEDFEIDAENLCTIDGNIITETAKFVSSDGESGTYPTSFDTFYFMMGCKIDNSDDISDVFFIDTDLTQVLPSRANSIMIYKPTMLQDGMCFYNPKCNNVKKLITKGYINVLVTMPKGLSVGGAKAKLNHNYGELYLVHRAGVGADNLYLFEGNPDLNWIKIADAENITNINATSRDAKTSFDLRFIIDSELSDINTVGGFMLVLKFWGESYKNDGTYLNSVRSSSAATYEINYGKFDLSVSFEAHVNENKIVSVTPSESVFRQIVSKINNGRYNVNIDTTMFNSVASDDLLSSGNMLKRAEYRIRGWYTNEYTGDFVVSDTIMVILFGNTWVINNNPANNGGYRFDSFQWYINGQYINGTTNNSVISVDQNKGLWIFIDTFLMSDPFVSCEVSGVDSEGNEVHFMVSMSQPPEDMQFGILHTLDGYHTNGTIKTSLEKFLEYCYTVYNYRFCVNYDIDNDAYTVFLAHYDDMFTDQLIDNLGDKINDFSLTLWREKLYTRVIIGHEVDDDTVNKEREFNCRLTFNTPNTEIEENELSVICPYIAYSRGIEEYLIEHYDSDDKGDNGAVYLIHGKDNGWDEFNEAKKYILNRDIAVLSGSLFPSYEWNVKYSPKRMLLSHWKELNGYLAFDTGKTITFKEADYNAELESTDMTFSIVEPIHSQYHGGGIAIQENVVVEKDNLPVTDDRSFLPLIVSVSGAGKEWLIRKIESNRYGVIRFEYNGKEYEGHIAYENDAISINPMNEQQCDFKLLLTKY